MAKNMPELPASPMFPAGGVAPYGRPSMGTRDQQEEGAPEAASRSGNPGGPDGGNPSVDDSFLSKFGSGPKVHEDMMKTPNSPCEPGKPGAY